jgi:hypothetical protein
MTQFSVLVANTILPMNAFNLHGDDWGRVEERESRRKKGASVAEPDAVIVEPH